MRKKCQTNQNIPHICHPPSHGGPSKRAVPINQVKAELNVDVRLGILEKALPYVDCTKEIGQHNCHCKHSSEHTTDTLRMSTTGPAPKDGTILFSQSMPGMDIIPLTDDSHKYFEFQTDLGCYHYKVAPEGFLGSGDHYVWVYNRNLNELYNSQADNPESVYRCFTDDKDKWTLSAWGRCIDNTLLWAKTEKQAFLQVWIYLQFCGSKGIIFNKEKLTVLEKETEIFDFRVTQSGVKHSLNQLEAITEYKLPTQLREIRGKLRERLKTSVAWNWTPEDMENFNKLKTQVCTDTEKGIKRLFVKSGASLILISDWSKAGSGFCLYEVCCDCAIKWPNGDTDKDIKGIKQLCCPVKCRLIMAR